MTRWAIVTDLDGSLLDAKNYSFEAARPALEEVRQRDIPLILCTSKTAAETIRIQRDLGIAAPFVIESGGGIWTPKGMFPWLPAGAEDRGAWELLPLAARRPEVLRGLAHLKGRLGVGVRGFSDMSLEEVAGETGLAPELAALAMDREFDEPFTVAGEGADLPARLSGLAGERGLRVTRGGRFHHLHGDTDKGRAVRLLRALYRMKAGEIRTIGVGDSEMDLPLLAEVDVAIAVLRPDGTHDPALCAGIPRLRRIPKAGPEGWNIGILEALSETKDGQPR